MTPNIFVSETAVWSPRLYHLLFPVLMVCSASAEVSESPVLTAYLCSSNCVARDRPDCHICAVTILARDAVHYPTASVWRHSVLWLHHESVESLVGFEANSDVELCEDSSDGF